MIDKETLDRIEKNNKRIDKELAKETRNYYNQGTETEEYKN